MLANHLVQRLVALIEKGGVDLSTVQHLIIDEADRLFDDGLVLTLLHDMCYTRYACNRRDECDMRHM